MTDLNDAATTLVTPFGDGRLAAHLNGFAARLGDQGYAPATMRQKHDLLAEFGLWRRPTMNESAGVVEP